MLARIDTADLDAKLIERRASSSREGAARAGREDAHDEPGLLEAELHLAERVRQLRVEPQLSHGSVMSAEAQVQPRAKRAEDAVATAPLSGIVAKRHVQPGEKVAFDSPLVTVVDLSEMELQAMVPAVDIPELADRDDGRADGRRLRRSQVHRPHRAHQSVHRAGHARAFSCSSAFRTPMRRCAAACSRRAGIALAAARR